MAYGWRGRLDPDPEAQEHCHLQVWTRVSPGCVSLQWAGHLPGADYLAMLALDSHEAWRVC